MEWPHSQGSIWAALFLFLKKVSDKKTNTSVRKISSERNVSVFSFVWFGDFFTVFPSSTSSRVVQYYVRSLTNLSGFCNFAASNVMYSSPSNLCLNFNSIMLFAINSYVKAAITFLFTTCVPSKYLKRAYKELSHISSKSVYRQHQRNG